MDNMEFLQEICANCGLTYGSHHGGTSPYPMDCCPGHEDHMDWENGPGTVFKPTGRYGRVDSGTLAEKGGINGDN